MRRKSERVKDKDKPVDKKTEKSSKKSRTRSSRRRKKSSSTSPESSETEDYDTSLRSSHDDTEEEHSSGRSRREKSKTVYAEDADTPAVDAACDEKVSSGRTRRSSKKQTADDEEHVSAELSGLKSDEISAEGTDSKGETSDQKHKEKEGKSSMWQVKSADCSSGEIKKLKICIVRPPEATELSPRKRKKLSRSSHREAADGETDEGLARDSSGERRKSRRSLRHDDSASPEKKGKHKSGDSSEDGHRTQDSEEMTQGIVEVSVDKPVAQEESSQDEVMTITTTEEAIEEISEVSDPLDVRTEVCDPLEPSSSPQVTFEDKSVDSPPQSPEKSIDSPIPSPEPVVETPVDPFDALKSSDVKSINKGSSVNNTVDDGPTIVAEQVVPCDSTQELQRSQKTVIEADQLPDETSKETGSPEGKSEVCDSSVELPKSQDSPEEVLTTRASSEEREKSPDSIKEPARPSARESSEEKQNVGNSVEKNIDIQETVEKTQGPKLLVKSSVAEESTKEQTIVETFEKENNVVETSKECKTVRDSSKERPSVQRLSEEKSRSRDETSPGRTKDRRRSKPRDSPEHKSRSRRLNRYSTGDRANRHKTSPQKSTHIEEPKNDVVVKEDTSKKEKERVEVKAKERVQISPKKSKEEREHRRTKVVWEEKPPVESRRRRPSPEHANQNIVSSEPNAKEMPPKQTEKITLKRSTSNKTKPVTEDGEDSKRLPVDGSKEEQTDAELTANVPRKRRWGAGKTSSVPKKPVLSISSDSLKNLIPEAKPLAISEVQLSPEEAEEGEVGDDSEHAPSEAEEEERTVEIEPTGRENARDVKLVSPAIAPEGPAPRVNIVLTDDHRDKTVPVRKISIVTDEMRSLQRSPSPARHGVSNVLFITNLVRPFTLNQLKELLARTGTLVEGGFWIDKIKSKCYVQYSSETEACETRHALHGVRWPVSNPKQLSVDYAKKEDLDLARELSEGGQIPRKTQPLKVENWEAEREKERERLNREKEKIERERLRGKEPERDRNVKMSASVREWDVGKMEMGSYEDGRESREDRKRELEKRMRKERDYRSPSPRDEPARKVKKKEEDAPAKLLDDLFKKTKVTPCIYWLPLTAEQIVVKEEMRRKHMAEHERRMAEMRKAERGGGGGAGRNQGRPPPQRRFPDNRDKRNKRRSVSGSPKK